MPAESNLLLGELRGLGRDFHAIGLRFPRLAPQLLVSHLHKTPADWDLFFSALYSPYGPLESTGTAGLGATRSIWNCDRHWQPFPDCRRCGYFMGDREALDAFLNLARRGDAVLHDLAPRVGETAHRGGLELPDVNTAEYGFMELAWRTAECCTAECGLVVRPFDPWRWPEFPDRKSHPDLLSEYTRGATDSPLNVTISETAMGAFEFAARVIALWLKPPTHAPFLPIDLSVTNPGPTRPTPAEPAPAEPAPEPPAARPVWDDENRELRWGATVIKKFEKRAGNQTTILAAFQELGWPRVMDDPLPGKEGITRAKRLGDTIADLNDGLDVKGVIVFERDGTGRIRWRTAE